MSRLIVSPPPIPPDRERTRTLLLDRLIFCTRASIGAFVTVLVLGVLIWRSGADGPWWLAPGVAAAWVIAGYVLIGGALCGAFLQVIRRWPRPLPPLQFQGAAFVRTWPFAAHRILSALAHPIP
jgi:hypothetical protein